MNMRIARFGITELIIVLSMIGALAVLGIRLVEGYVPVPEMVYTPAGLIVLSAMAAFLLVREFKAWVSSSGSTATRLTGAVRVPIYAVGLVFLIYSAINAWPV